ncbi:hypothetical protein MJO28_015306 [Puccinia striiformis f. sp. tritici]|uniref:Uncharacterized protein n=1 Tax=Puccinia striiformis f. sp. tritici TaxID=168172 RepID=A0ACC0DSW7_9BASI|nr:hypothetical protein MJO28_015306 [Puccinia striiformis f. sp. tritici]
MEFTGTIISGPTLTDFVKAQHTLQSVLLNLPPPAQFSMPRIRSQLFIHSVDHKAASSRQYLVNIYNTHHNSLAKNVTNSNTNLPEQREDLTANNNLGKHHQSDSPSEQGVPSHLDKRCFVTKSPPKDTLPPKTTGALAANKKSAAAASRQSTHLTRGRRF